MTGRRSRRRAVRAGIRGAGILLLVAAGACGVSQDEELALGEQTAREVEAQLEIVRDPAIAGFIQELGDSVAGLTARPELPWRFSVVNAAEVNAFAIPGGHIYVNRGLIERAAKLDELVGVLGHEIAHVTERHSAEQLESQRTANTGLAVVCTLTSICDSEIARVAITVGGTAVFARHSRGDEAEADSVGVHHVMRAGFDPRGIPDFFGRLLAQREREPMLLDAWFGTHPLEEERIEASRRHIASLGPDALEGLTRDHPAFAGLKARLARLPAPPVPARP
ncbi:MAG TPA: M48 family metallopeptidase [Gemmatimonadaceae bacterium]